MNAGALATRLPRVDAAATAMLARLLAALDGAPAGDMRLTASVDDGVPLPALRFATPGGDVEIAPRLVAGAVPQMLADDGTPDAARALAALGDLEPLIAAIEHQLGVGLLPSGVATAALPVRIAVALAGADGAVVHAAVLGVAADAGFRPPPLPLDPAVAGRVRLPLIFRAAGPALVPSRIAGMAPGDLLLVGARLAGEIAAGDRRWPAVLDPGERRLTHSDHGSSPLTDTPLDPDLRLGLTLRIDGGSCSLADLARLAPGGVLPLGIAGETLPVTVEVSGSPVASGELVAIGDGYGVMIRRVAGTGD